MKRRSYTIWLGCRMMCNEGNIYTHKCVCVCVCVLLACPIWASRARASCQSWLLDEKADKFNKAGSDCTQTSNRHAHTDTHADVRTHTSVYFHLWEDFDRHIYVNPVSYTSPNSVYVRVNAILSPKPAFEVLRTSQNALSSQNCPHFASKRVFWYSV